MKLIRSVHIADWSNFIEVSFQVEHHPSAQACSALRSISTRHARRHSQTENKRTGLDCFLPLFPPPPLPRSTCLCSRLRLMSEALSFVFVRCPKDCRMKRDTWRGVGWVRLWCVTARAQKLSPLNLTHSLVPVNPSPSPSASKPTPPPFPNQSIFSNAGKVERRDVGTQMEFNWNRDGLKRS